MIKSDNKKYLFILMMKGAKNKINKHTKFYLYTSNPKFFKIIYSYEYNNIEYTILKWNDLYITSYHFKNEKIPEDIILNLVKLSFNRLRFYDNLTDARINVEKIN